MELLALKLNEESEQPPKTRGMHASPGIFPPGRRKSGGGRTRSANTRTLISRGSSVLAPAVAAVPVAARPPPAAPPATLPKLVIKRRRSITLSELPHGRCQWRTISGGCRLVRCPNPTLSRRDIQDNPVCSQQFVQHSKSRTAMAFGGASRVLVAVH